MKNLPQPTSMPLVALSHNERIDAIKPALKQDQTQTLRFLQVLTGDQKPSVTYQTFADSKGGDPILAGKLHGVLPGDNYKKLKYKQTKGAGVFGMINEGDGKGRKAENVVRVRALFLDLDGAPLEPARDALRPHIVVESSPGKFHLYWKVSDCPLGQFGPLQKAIARRFGGDSSVSDLPRVMRLPGFFHQKGEPVMTRLVKAEDFPSYSVSEVIQGLGLDTASFTATQPQEKPEPPTVTAGTSPLEVVDTSTGEVEDLRAWAVRHPDFMIATALHKYAPQVLRDPSKDGKQHIVCPFEEEHTEHGGSGTYVVDGTAAKKTRGFVIHCCHAHCSNRDRLDFIKEMLAKGWLPLSALKDPRFLADERRPKKIYYPGEELQKHPGFTQLSPTGRGQFMYLFEHVGCFIEEGGAVPDNSRTICRYLGCTEEDWLTLRETLLDTGLCKAEGDRLVSDVFAAEDEKATRAFNVAIRKARAGGSKTQGTQAPA